MPSLRRPPSQAVAALNAEAARSAPGCAGDASDLSAAARGRSSSASIRSCRAPQARVAGAGEVLDRRPRRHRVVPRGSATDRPGPRRSAEPPRRHRVPLGTVGQPDVRRHAPGRRGLGADRRARVVRGGRVGAHAGDGRHGTVDGPRAAHRPDHGTRAPRWGRRAVCWSAAATSPGPRIPPPASRWPWMDDRSMRGTSAPGFFLRTVDLPPGSLAGDGPFARLTIQSTAASGEAPIPSAIEQFDVQPPDTMMWGFDEGWQEAEYSPALGVWRWTSDRAVIRIVGATTPLRVTLRFEPPVRYFGAASDISVSAGPMTLSAASVLNENTLTFAVPLDAIAASDGTHRHRDDADLRARGARRRARSSSSRAARVRNCAWIASVCVDTARSEAVFSLDMIRSDTADHFARARAVDQRGGVRQEGPGSRTPAAATATRRSGTPAAATPTATATTAAGASCAHRGADLREEDGGPAECRATSR